MAYRITAAPASLRSSAEIIDTNAEKIRLEIERIREAIEPLRSTFIGQRASKFFEHYDVSSAEMAEWDDIVRSFAQEMREAAMRIESADTV